MHTISEEEREAFAGHINLILASDVFLQDRLPMDPADPNALFEVGAATNDYCVWQLKPC